MTATVERASTISASIAEGRRGITMGNRLSVPFRMELMNIVVGAQTSHLGEPETITDFSPASRSVCVVDLPDRTDLYFRKYDSLQKALGHWKGTMVLTCCEKGGDVFDPAGYRRLVLTFRDDDPRVRIEEKAPEIPKAP